MRTIAPAKIVSGFDLSRDTAVQGAKFFLIGSSCKPRRTPSYFFGLVNTSESIQLRFVTANSDARRLLNESGSWRAEIRCLDQELKLVTVAAGKSFEQVVFATGDSFEQDSLDLNVLPDKPVQFVLVSLISEEPDRCFDMRVRLIKPKPVIPEWFARSVQSSKFDQILRVAKEVSPFWAGGCLPSNGGGALRKAYAVWEELSVLVPGNCRSALLGGLFDLACFSNGIRLSEKREVKDSYHQESISVSEAAARVIPRLVSEGIGGCLHELYAVVDGKTLQSRVLEQIADLQRLEGNADPTLLYWLAYGSNPTAAKARNIARKLFKHGDIESAGALAGLESFEGKTAIHGEIALSARLLRELNKGILVPSRSESSSARPLRAGSPKVAYVAALAQPWQIVGYTIRTQELLRALKNAAVDVECFVRPGYPADRSGALPVGQIVPERAVIDNVVYHYSALDGVARWRDEYIQRVAEDLARQFVDRKIEIVHAASNSRNALPALMAARRLSLPFIYEIRGFWELTATSKNAAWMKTQRYELDHRLEIFVASESDHVFAITDGVIDELATGGVPRSKLSLLPNAVDPERFTPKKPDGALAKAYRLEESDLVLVYAGSLTNYEGTDDLIEAIAILRDRDIRVIFLVVGSGAMLMQLKQQVKDRKLDDQVHFLGPRPPGEVSEHLALADVVALPRKPFRVCEIVSPLKPFEAMAMAKPVILSDLPVSREIVTDGVTGLLCAPADPTDLARVLERLFHDVDLRECLGRQGHDWVVKSRSWATNARIAADVYGTILAHRAA
jgi:glycosyltransferase involved in cell wall biosynthesis